MYADDLVLAFFVNVDNLDMVLNTSPQFLDLTMCSILSCFVMFYAPLKLFPF